MTREQLGVLLDARDKLCAFCPAVECETCYVPRLIEKHKRMVAEKNEAEWIPHRFDQDGKPISWYCSNCKAIGNRGHFCSHCGFKMKERES